MGQFARLGNALYSGDKSINFVGRRWLWYTISAVVLGASLLGLQVRGLDMGIEFVGGAEYRVSLPAAQVNQDVADDLRAAVAETGIPNAAAPVVTTSGREAILVQTQPLTPEEGTQVIDAIVGVTGVDPDASISQSEIGPSWGQQVAKRAIIGLIVFLVLVILFIWAYFREWKMSISAILALAHDVLITIGVYAWSGFEVTPATVTGLLTILGFSLYDTVVVFDKVRENTANLRKSHKTYAEQANLAVNQTLVRSINTSVVALIPVGVILWVSTVQLGASALKDLALALFVGMAAGAYSSIFIATPFLVQIKERESEVRQSDRRARSRQRHEADRYASVPAYTEGMPVVEEPADLASAGAGLEPEPVDLPAEPRPRPAKPAPGGPASTPAPPRGPVRPSGSANRSQPVRQSRAKRGQK